MFGRGNAEGFLGFWSTVAGDENADPRDRGYAKWLVDTEKVVFSTTLTEAPWERTRVVNASVADVVTDLKSTGDGRHPGQQQPERHQAAAGGGPDRPALPDGLPRDRRAAGRACSRTACRRSKWTLAHHETGELGEMALVYDRAR